MRERETSDKGNIAPHVASLNSSPAREGGSIGSLELFLSIPEHNPQARVIVGIYQSCPIPVDTLGNVCMLIHPRGAG